MAIQSALASQFPMPSSKSMKIKTLAKSRMQHSAAWPVEKLVS